MKLSRLFLNPVSRDVARAQADSQALHRRVMDMFGASDGPARAEHAVLYRLDVSERDGTIVLLLQSRDAPALELLPEHFLDPRAGADAAATTDLGPLLARLEEGSHFRFRLRANPTRKIDTKSGPDGVRRNGRRVPLRTPEARLGWLDRKLSAAGFVVVGGSEACLVKPDGLQRGRRGDARMTHEGVVYEGVLSVVDAALARRSLADGIGPAKAYGFGLLSLSPCA
jgi:CRISPR system Cascade subunit CasE